MIGSGIHTYDDVHDLYARLEIDDHPMWQDDDPQSIHGRFWACVRSLARGNREFNDLIDKFLHPSKPSNPIYVMDFQHASWLPFSFLMWEVCTRCMAAGNRNPRGVRLQAVRG
jgi:hypothetical protein